MTLSNATDKPLKGETVAVLIASGFNENEMTAAQRALLETGARIRTITVEAGLVHGWHGQGWGHYFAADEQISNVLAADFSMLLVVGGQRSLDKLKSSAHTTRFLRGFLTTGKPVALYGDAVQMLIHMEQAAGKTVTGPGTMEATMIRAGATWTEEPVAVTDNVLTGQTEPENMPDLVRATVAHFMTIPTELRMAA